MVKPPRRGKIKSPDKQLPKVPGVSLWQIPPVGDLEPSELERALRERIKELNCLYRIAQLAERRPDSIHDLLEDVVNVLPPSWQYPEITCARIVFEGKSHKSRRFKVSKWRQTARILLYDKPIGEVAVFYLEECPPLFEGPFLREERLLLNTVAEHIAVIAKRIALEQELLETNKLLIVERESLREANSALRVILARIEEEKLEIHRAIQANMEKIVMPILDQLLRQASESQRNYVELARQNLAEITSPFVSRMPHGYQALTPTEISVCNMVSKGLRTKEIAQMRSVSPATISRHRERIRQKLGIVGRKANLTTYLQTIG